MFDSNEKRNISLLLGITTIINVCGLHKLLNFYNYNIGLYGKRGLYKIPNVQAIYQESDFKNAALWGGAVIVIMIITIIYSINFIRSTSSEDDWGWKVAVILILLLNIIIAVFAIKYWFAVVIFVAFLALIHKS